MEKIFYNVNGKVYYILFGKFGQKAFLCNLKENQFVICQLLEKNSWWHGEYFIDFDKAYTKWKKQGG